MKIINPIPIFSRSVFFFSVVLILILLDKKAITPMNKSVQPIDLLSQKKYSPISLHKYPYKINVNPVIRAVFVNLLSCLGCLHKMFGKVFSLDEEVGLEAETIC
jgi:hypothetical protein